MIDSRGALAHSAAGLGLIVFVAGGTLMAVEIVGGQTIAPYFGSNVFVWGSVLSAFMGALSAGYVIGGRLADRAAGPLVLSLLLGAAGAWIVGVPFAGPSICRALLAADPGGWMRTLLPLAAVVAMYFVPSVLLGMITPVAIRLASTALERVGTVVGRLYALNALGSVAGALLSTLVLVAYFGNRAVLIGCGAAMIIAAAVGFALNARLRTTGAPSPSPDPPAAEPHASPARSGSALGLRLLVFVCGAVFMSLQVIGGAEIAPYFGGSVFVWGCVITVFLGALSLGYRAGGRIADRRPTMMTLATIVVAAGITTLLVPILAPPVCSGLMGPSIKGLNLLRPLFAVIVLFFLPTTLYAMIAPFAVRLAARDLGKVGGVAGRLYALSTAGNVAGVLLTTFVLINLLGKTWLLELAGIAAVAVAILAVFLHNRARGERRQPWLVSAGLLLACVALTLVPKPPLVPLTRQNERIVGEKADPRHGDWKIVEYVYGYDVDEPVAVYSLRRVRHERESPYHHIAVIEHDPLAKGESVTSTDGRVFTAGGSWRLSDRPHRDLRFDQYVESSVILKEDANTILRPYTSGTTYSDMLHIPLVLHPDARSPGGPQPPRRSLIIGGGGGVVPEIFKETYPKMSIDVVEIDPVVAEVAQRWFGMTPDERLRVFVQDGRLYLHNTKEKYDTILLDAYTAGGRIPFHLTTREFLEAVKARVAPDGVVLMNVISAVQGPASELFRAEYKVFSIVFGRDRVYVFPKVTTDLADWDRNEPTNIMIVATTRQEARLSKAELLRRAERLAEAGRLHRGAALVKHIRAVRSRKWLEAVPLDDVPLLTDDFAPVDLMAVELDR
jgi:spermidine synthase